jgi:signal peptidase II
VKQEDKFNWSSVWRPWHIAIVLGCFVLDQLTKYWVIFTMPLYSSIPVFPGFEIVHIKNRGAAFGMFHDTGPVFRILFFGTVTLVCIWLLISWLGTTPRSEKWQRLGLCLILGGALGNVKDRVIFGEVTDFVHVYYRAYSWPAFNIADAAICVGVGVILAVLLQQKWAKRKSASA